MIIGFTRYTTGDPTKPYTVQGCTINYGFISQIRSTHDTAHGARDSRHREPRAVRPRSQVAGASCEVARKGALRAGGLARVESLSYTEEKVRGTTP